MVILLSLAAVALAVISLYGWGRIACRVVRMPDCNGPLTVTLGLAALIFVGGVANLLGVAYRPVLIGLVVIGVGISIDVGRRGFRHQLISVSSVGRYFHDHVQALVVLAVLSLLLAGVMAGQFNPQSYNVLDDFQKYFAHPVRMLATGTVASGPLNAMGSEALGAKAFLDAFVFAFAPFQFLNAADGVFGWFLSALLITRFTLGRRALWPITALSLAAFLLIDPMFVNTAPVYLGVAMIIGVLTLLVQPAGEGEATPLPNPLAIGLLQGTLLALKLTFVLFVSVQCMAVIIVIWIITKRISSAARWAAIAAASTAVVFLPWLLIHWRLYWAGIRHPYRGVMPVEPGSPETINLLSFDRVGNGIYYGSYFLLVVAAVLLAAIGLWAARRSSNTRLRMSAYFLTTATLGLAVAHPVLLLILRDRLAGFMHSVRYFAPLAIAIVPASIAIVSPVISDLQPARSRRFLFSALVAVTLLGVITFTPSLVERVRIIQSGQSMLAFSNSMSQADVRQIGRVFDRTLSKKIKTLQQLIPPGEPVMAWLNAPFFLDYARNPIIDVDFAGLSTSWARPPAVRYVMWDYAGYPTFNEADLVDLYKGPGARPRTSAARSIDLIRQLKSAARHAKVLYCDEETIVFYDPGPPP